MHVCACVCVCVCVFVCVCLRARACVFVCLPVAARAGASPTLFDLALLHCCMLLDAHLFVVCSSKFIFCREVSFLLHVEGLLDAVGRVKYLDD